MESQLPPPPAPQVFAKPQGQRLRWWAWSWIGRGLAAYALFWAFQQGTFAGYGYGQFNIITQNLDGMISLSVMALSIGVVFKREETFSLLSRALDWLKARRVSVK
ncbi:MAG: hypothetical protein KGN01_07550 [Patescibacteria group bacterium]|nr:hypothetical protein [Patescibacteria group bacterium]